MTWSEVGEVKKLIIEDSIKDLRTEGDEKDSEVCKRVLESFKAREFAHERSNSLQLGGCEEKFKNPPLGNTDEMLLEGIVGKWGERESLKLFFFSFFFLTSQWRE